MLVLARCLAKEKMSKRYAAIKQLKNTIRSEQKDIIHEIETILKFENSNVVTYYHHFWEEETLFLGMEFCSGGSLNCKISRKEVKIT